MFATRVTPAPSSGGHVAAHQIAEHRGRIVKTTGDGMLAEFVSAVDATRCAVDIQLAVASANLNIAASKRVELRIGIHVGDIISDEGGIFGDGVNIAARLELSPLAASLRAS